MVSKGRDAFWSHPDQVERFASRAPDIRLLQLLPSYTTPPSTRVLDLGCAGGRNAVALAERRFDVVAIDSSPAMVQKTRERLAPMLGSAEADRRVRLGRMDDLSEFDDESFDLVVALGVYHQASSLAEWRSAIAETARVLLPQGLALVSVFTPASQPQGEPLRALPDRPSMYDGFSSGPLCLLHPDQLDRAFSDKGLEPIVPTETVEVATEQGFRVSANGLYRRRALTA